MNKNITQSLIFAALVLGVSYLVFWGPIAFFHLRTANLVEGKIYNPLVFAMFVLGGFVPSVVGIVLTSIFEGRKGLGALLLSAINIKIGHRLLLTIMGYVLLLGILQITLYTFLGGKFDYRQFLVQLPSLVPLILLGPLSEEFGWRGFLQKRLSSEFHPVLASLVLGIVWSFWHLPLFYMSGTFQHEFGIPFLSFLISVTGSAFVYTYIFNESKGSLFSALFLHWTGTYVMQVVASQVYAAKIAAYNFLECTPVILIAGAIIFLMSMKRIIPSAGGDGQKVHT